MPHLLLFSSAEGSTGYSIESIWFGQCKMELAAICAPHSQSIPRLLCFLIVASIQIMCSWDNGLLRRSLASSVCAANVKGHSGQSVRLYYYQQLCTALWNSSGQLEPQILLSSVKPGYSVPVSLALCVFEPGGV